MLRSVTVLAVAALLVSGCNIPKSKEEIQKDKNAVPEFTIKAKEILKAYEENEVGADQKYKGKIVQISGVVDTVGKGMFDSSFVTVGSGKPYEFRLIQCGIEKSEESVVANMKPKQKITIKGRVTGLFGNIGIDDCVVVPEP